MRISRVEWTDYTWNPWSNRESTSDTGRVIGDGIGDTEHEPRVAPAKNTSVWRAPFSWHNEATAIRARYRISTCSKSDFFHPGADAWRQDAWKVIRDCDRLDWLLLTEQPELIADRLPTDWGDGYPNVWLGVTIESQTQIGRFDYLTEIPAAIRFVFAEPLVGPIRFGSRIGDLDWVVLGCEKGVKRDRRPMDMEWVRDIRDLCKAYRVPLFLRRYYRGGKLRYDGVLGNVKHLSWPRSSVSSKDLTVEWLRNGDSRSNAPCLHAPFVATTQLGK